MKKWIVLILVIALILVIDQKPWREEEVVPNTSVSTYGSYGGTGVQDYKYTYDYDYDYDWDEDDSFTMKCYTCHGSGRCQDCGGTGRSKLKGVLAAGGCALCDASGRCYKCDGKGYTVHY